MNKKYLIGVVIGFIISLCVAFTYTLDCALPVGTQAPSVLDDYARNDKSAWAERMNVDHYFDLTGTEVSDAATGQHRQVEFYGPITKPTSAANKSWLYAKDVSDVVELHWEDESGNEIQLTTVGKIKKASIEDYEANLLNPPGIVTSFAGSTAPTGWLMCNGQAVSRTTYAALFAVTSTTYGVGNGTTTFNVPDLVGYFVRGLDTVGAVDADARTLGSTQTDAFQGHKHSVTHNVHTGDEQLASGGTTVSDNDTGTITIGSPTTDGSNGTPRTDSETRPLNIALNYIIKI